MYYAEIISVPVPEKYNTDLDRNEINIIQRIISQNLDDLEPNELILGIEDMIEKYVNNGITLGDIILLNNEVAITYLEHIRDFVEENDCEIEYGIKVLFEPYSNDTMYIIWS